MDFMKMYKFVNEKWIDVTENASIFERYGMSDFLDVIATGDPVKFDCDESEFIRLLDWIDEDKTCLDDCDYYNLIIDLDISDWNKILIFDNFTFQTFDECIKVTENHLKWLNKRKNLM